MAILSAALCSRAQSFKGIWQGYISAEDSYISGYSLNILQQEGNIISGKAYLYHNTAYHAEGRFDFIGTINGSNAKITELKIIDSIMPSDTVALCLKLMDLELLPQNDFDYLVGPWHGDSYRRESCIPGKAYLRRYTTKSPDGIEPVPPQLLTEMLKDKPSMKFRNTELSKPIIISVKKNVVTLSVSDYLRADHDTVSLYYNRTPIAEKLHILKKAKKYVVRLDKLSGLNEVIMYANNLGEVPPNTSTLTIDDGIKKQTVIISSTLQTSAVLYLKYEPD